MAAKEFNVTQVMDGVVADAASTVVKLNGNDFARFHIIGTGGSVTAAVKVQGTMLGSPAAALDSTDWSDIETINFAAAGSKHSALLQGWNKVRLNADWTAGTLDAYVGIQR